MASRPLPSSILILPRSLLYSLSRSAGWVQELTSNGNRQFDAAFQQVRHNWAHVAVAVGVPQVDAVLFEFLIYALVARHDHVFEEAHRNDGAALIANIFPARSIIELKMRQHLVQEKCSTITQAVSTMSSTMAG